MKHVNIACYSAFWGDSADAARQLVESENVHLDYLVADYLAEVTMGLLARSCKFNRRPGSASSPVGYIAEFLDLVLAPLLNTILDKGIKVVTNAGGLDPIGLMWLIEAHARSMGLAHRVKVAAVYGDDLLAQKDDLLQAGVLHGFDPLNGAGEVEALLQKDEDLLSLNSYLGGEPIAKALRSGANIIVTGRCVDSALVVGPLAFEYGWNFANIQDQVTLDRLASASLAGHILECGAQVTGGNYTDWKESAFSPHGGWANMGYPIATYYEDGSFIVTKPENTGGLVNEKSVCEQMLYEVLDPENYILPDIVLDLSSVELKAIARHRVRVTGALGKVSTPWLKCTAIAQQGHRISVEFVVLGQDAEIKGLAMGRAILERTNRILRNHKNIKSISQEKSDVLIIGAERSLVPTKAPSSAREVIVRISATHDNAKALTLLSKEVSSFITNSAPGTFLLSPGRPRPSPNFTTASVLIEKEAVNPKVVVEASSPVVDVSLASQGCKPVQPSKTAITFSADMVRVSERTEIPAGTSRTRLIEIAVGRSGDKGDTANVAIIARNPRLYPYILAQVTPEAIWKTLGHFVGDGGTVTRYEVPGVSAVNFVITKCLGGGGLASLRLDKQGKGYAQICLSNLWVDVPLKAMMHVHL